ncbi:hypothetical protein ACH4XT_04890 [Streptomyces avidinii]|uniref:hypothetical protein n=1 Tax=Streptomyces avidinii TaxID=1895 RepID=UPI0037AE919C
MDTNVLLDAFLGRGEIPPEGHVITSTVAHEFLMVRDRGTGKSRYFVPSTLLADFMNSGAPYGLPRHQLRFGRPSNLPLHRKSTDRLVMDFNNDYPSVVEYGHRGISSAVNQKNLNVFRSAIGHLGKAESKALESRFEFLTALGLPCRSTEDQHLELAYQLLHEFKKQGKNPKKDFRNTLNDLLILSYSLESNSTLWTGDEELLDLAEPFFDAKREDSEGRYRLIQASPEKARARSRESKGYINRSWRFTRIN